MPTAPLEPSAELDGLCARCRVKSLYLFGSALRAEFDPSRSDLDFYVEFEALPPAQLADAFFELKEGLEALFKRPSDLVTPAALKNPYFADQVLRSRQRLYAA